MDGMAAAREGAPASYEAAWDGEVLSVLARLPGGGPAGYLHALREGDAAEISLLEVPPPLRRRGIGGGLVAAMAAECAAAGVRLVRVMPQPFVSSGGIRGAVSRGALAAFYASAGLSAAWDGYMEGEIGRDGRILRGPGA